MQPPIKMPVPVEEAPRPPGSVDRYVSSFNAATAAIHSLGHPIYCTVFPGTDTSLAHVAIYDHSTECSIEYNAERMETLTFAEGDWTWVQCADKEAWEREIQSMAAFYGNPPPFAKGYDMDGTVTHYYSEDARP